MAGKSNTSATFFAQKKLLGKAHTSNLKVDGEELIGSNIQAASSLIFGEEVPVSASLDLYTIQSASDGGPETIEYIPFILTALTGTTYDANSSNPDGGSGTDTGESSQVSGPHTYKFVLPSDYTSNTSNARAGNGFFNDNKIVHETLGKVQLVPPFFSQQAPNPYIVKIYKDDGVGGVGDEIPLLDNIDWNVDYYNGILFLQDYKADKIPAHARAFAYVGKMADEVISSGGSGGGSGDANAEYVLTTATGSLPNGKVIEAGDGITLTAGANTLTITSTLSSVTGREKVTYFVTQSHSALAPLDLTGVDFSTVTYDSNKIDINLNGQLLHTGSSAQVTSGVRDYYLSNTGSIVFGKQLFNDDIIDAVISVVGESGASSGGDAAASYLVLSNTGSLSNERAFVASTGLTTVDAGANGNFTLTVDDSVVATLSGSQFSGNVGITGSLGVTLGLSGSLTTLVDGTSYLAAGPGVEIVSASNGQVTVSASNTNGNYVFNEYLGQGDAVNTLFTLAYTPTENKNVAVYVNGLLQMPATNITSAPYQDYSVTGSNVYFTTASIPSEGSVIMTNYTTNETI